MTTPRYSYYRCRTIGHAWDDITGIARHQPNMEILHGVRRVFRCDACTTERREVWSDVTGELVEREYRYPDDYVLDVGELDASRSMRESMRLEYIAQTTRRKNAARTAARKKAARTRARARKAS